MRVEKKKKKEFMKFTEKERDELKYNPQHAAVIRDILENGESFTREKWDSIYKSKQTFVSKLYHIFIYFAIAFLIFSQKFKNY